MVPVLLLLGALLASNAFAQTLKLQFKFEDTGTTTADSVAGVTLNIVSNTTAMDLHGAPGSGVAGRGKALDFSTANGTVNLANELASTTANAALGFGSVSTWTRTYWLKPATGETLGGSYGFRTFILGANSISDQGQANSIGDLQKGGQANQITFNTDGSSNLAKDQTCTPALAANHWLFFATVYDGTSFNIYEGDETTPVALLSSTTASTANGVVNFGTSGNLFLGNSGGNNRGLRGYLDDCRFYSGAGNLAFVEAVRRQALNLTVNASTFSPVSPVYQGSSVTVSASTYGGTSPYTYDWQRSTDGGVTYSTDLGAGNGDGTYTLNTTGQGGTTYYYRLVVTDSGSPAVTVTNVAGALVVSSTPLPPTVVSNATVTPSTILLGGSATLSAVIGGTPPISYQWQYSTTNNGTGLVNIPGATNTTFVLSNAQYASAGYYRLTAANVSGATNTSFASLTVLTPVTIANAGSNDPIPGADDIAQLSTSGNTSSPGGMNYYSDNGTPPGQTFTTGSNPAGYSIASILVKSGFNGGISAGNPWCLRLYSMASSQSGNATLIATYNNENSAPAIGLYTWIKWYGRLTNVLSPNTAYAYTIQSKSSSGSGSGYLQLANASGNPYANGRALQVPYGGGGPVYGTSSDYDATFLVHLASVGAPAIADVSLSPGVTNLAGGTVTLTASAIGTNLTYLWQQDYAPVGSSTNVLTINTASLSAGSHYYQLTVTNAAGSATSALIDVEVVPAIINSISLAPANSVANPVYAGTPVTLSASVTGTNLTYIWQQNYMDIPGSNTNLFTLDTSAMSPGTYTYTLRVINSSGEVDSSTALTLNSVAASGPILTSGATLNPSVVLLGNNTTVSATFVGSQPLTYQWFFDNGGGTVAIPGATNASYTLTGAQNVNQGTYYLTAYNHPPGLGAQQSNSAPAYLYVVAPAQTNTTLASISDGGTSPFVGSYDISQLMDSSIQPAGLNYYADDPAPPGQLFTTGATPPAGFGGGFPLNYFYFKHDPTGGGSANSTLQTYNLYVYQMLNGTNAQLLTKYVTTNAVTFNSGDWVRIAGLTNILQPSTTYAVSLQQNGGSWWRLACTVYTSPGPNGQACLTPALGGAVQLSSPNSTAYGFPVYYDAAYVAGLTPPSVPVELAPMTLVPSSLCVGQGPVVMTASFIGSQPITYQWQVNSGSGYINIPGATNTTYTIPVAALTNAGTYQCLASNSLSAGTPTPSTAQYLTVNPSPTTSFVANFAYWNTHPGAASPGYSGPGVIGTGMTWNRPVPGTVTNVFNGTIATLCQNPPSAVADDGYSSLGSLTLSAYATKTDDFYWYSTVPSGEITLLDTFMDNQSTNAIPFAISNAFNGCYNLVLFAENGRNTSARTTFTVNGLSQTLTNTSASLNQFVLGNNYVVFYNIPVTNGTLVGTWSNPSGSTNAVLNGAQLQMAYSADNPQMFIVSQPVDVTVPVGRPASVSVMAEGPGTNWLPGPVFYQWYDSNNSPLVGATNNTYAPDTSVAFTRTYYCVATNLTGLSISSASATITVYQPDTLVWLGSAGDAWDTSTANWNDITSAASPVAYADPQLVRFDDSASDFSVSNAVTLTPSSVIVSNSANNYVFYGSGSISGVGSLTKLGNGTLTISNNQAYTGGTIVNGGTLVLAKGGAAGALTGTLTANVGTTIRLTAGDALGYGVNRVTVLNLNGATMDNATPNNESYSTTWNLMGGTMSSSGGGVYNISPADGYSINSLATNVTSVISGNIALRNSGLTISTAPGTVPGGIDLNISGRIYDAGGNTLTKTGNGTLSLSGVNSFNGDITVNAGKLRIDGSGSLNNGNYTAHLFINGTDFSYNSSANQSLGAISGSGTLTMNGSGTLTMNGSSDYTNTTTVNAGTLAGTGNVGGALIVNSGAMLAPGSGGVGTLSVNGNVTLNAGSTSLFEVNGSTRANDQVVLGAGVTYGGVLKIVPSGTFAAGQRFTLFSGAGAANASNFASIVGDPGNGNYFTFANGVLSVASAGGPSGSNQLTNTVTGTTMTLSWGAGWRLQAQTNSLSKGLSTNWVYVTDGSQNSTNIVVDKSSPAVFFRLTYP